ncbi:hypothetical protein BDU57DRAFT_578231 [Ampelomyces quisqualis]|uniref:DRBM domain-containing protein n=1 Tax=Ampelomyces quisqualis TaxID=50730 RepID=A0A6A5QI23_AMPQU|nr:hypothetical protein BDU57DRAFT_578231 [Ampelomyces quisqualis]
MLSSGQTGEGTTPTPKLDGVYSLDDFMGSAEVEHAALKAARFAKAAQNKAASRKSKVSTPKLGGGPVAVGARSSTNTIALHEKYQALGIPQPSFSYGGSSVQGWHGEVSFPGLDVEELQGIKDATIYSNKQEAKEKLSGRALEILTRLESEGKVKKMTADARAKSSKYKVALHDKHQKLGIPQPFFDFTGSTDEGWTAEISFPGVEVNGLQGKTLKNDAPFPNKQEAREALSKLALELVETAEAEGHFDKFAKVKGPSQLETQEKKGPGPNYTGQLLDYRVGASLFTCQVTIETSDGTDAQIFGSLDSHFTSKKAARQAAAAVAVEHFKAQGLWPTSSPEGGIKKKKKNPSLTDTVPQRITAHDTPHHLPATCTTSPATSYPQQVVRLAVLLSLGTPEWRCVPSPLDRDFHTVSCYFSGGGAHKGPIGEVRNVFGKKKAKEECARLTLEYLQEVYAHRMAYGEAMMEGIRGGEGAVKGVLGKEVEGEEEVVGRDMEVDGDDEFEDAVETL